MNLTSRISVACGIAIGKVAACLAVLASLGCGEVPSATPMQAAAPPIVVAQTAPPAGKKVKVIPSGKDKPAKETTPPPPVAEKTPPLPKPKPRPTQGTLADLVEGAKPQGPKNEFGDVLFPLPKHDEGKLAVAGIRRLSGKHVTLFTDLPSTPETDELPAVFDAAVPQWCEFFGIDPKRASGWRMVGYLIGQKERFQGAGLIPDDLPPFLNGYQRGAEFWLYERPSAYMHRYLVVHEGTHGFMFQFLGGAGAPWYMEGTAEFFGTHAWSEGKLQTGAMPPSKESSPYWGRIKMIRDDYTADKALLLTDVMKYDFHAYLKNEPYSWSWAATYFLAKHPATQAEFAKLKANAADISTDFSRKLYDAVKADWPAIQEDWQLFVAHLDYGADVPSGVVRRKPAMPLPAEGAKIKIPADTFWQSSGYRVEAGQKYRLTAKGRYEIARAPQSWPCEPGGVTLRYYQGQPLGMLLAAVSDPDKAQGISPLVNPAPVGLGTPFTPTVSGVLYLGINETPGELADNRGELEVAIEAVK